MGIVSAMMQVGAAIKHAVAALFKVTHSLRFDGSSDHMTRTFGTPTNQTTWTLSFWFKRSRFGIREMLFATPGGTNQLYFDFLADNTMHVNDYVNSSSSNFKLVTNQTFTDNDWHHAVLMLDGSGNSPATKSKLFIDSVDLSTTSGLSTHTHTNISSFWNSANVVHYIGQYETGTLRFDGQLAEIHFVDGQALTAADFGETRNSQWVPKEVAGLNYGTNGFYLPFDRREEGVTLLLDGSSATTDLSSVETNTITNNTGVSVTNITGPYSSAQDVLSFDGVSDNLTFDIDSNMQLEGDFTVEAWVQRGDASGRECLWAYWGTSAEARCRFEFDRTTNNVTFTDVATHRDFSFAGTNADVDDTWFHAAVVRSGSTYEVFIDGTSLGTQTGSTTTFTGGASQNNKAVIGDLIASGTTPFVGKIADFRITKGIARDIAADWTAGVYSSPLTNDIKYGSLGRDATTNSNDFTVPANTLTPDDQLLDSPNLRFATWDTASVNVTLSEANLKATLGSSDEAIANESSALVSGGKFYCELYVNSLSSGGNSGTTLMPQVRAVAGGSEYSGYFNDGQKYGVSTGTYGTPYGANVVIRCAVDASTSEIWWGIDNTWQASGDPANGSNPATSGDFSGGNPPLYFALSDGTGGTTGAICTVNFGQDHTFAGSKSPLTSPYTDDDGNGEFYYQPPAGFKALATSY